MAAEAFNEFCGVGIAFNSSIGGVRMLDGTGIVNLINFIQSFSFFEFT